MFFELRKYYIQKGQKDSWIKYMEKTIMPFQISKGMVITGTFTSKNDKGEELYIWLRRFNSEKEKEQLLLSQIPLRSQQVSWSSPVPSDWTLHVWLLHWIPSGEPLST